MLQIRRHPFQETEICQRAAQGQPEDCLQGELQVRGAGEVSSKPGGHHAAAGRRILEVTI